MADRIEKRIELKAPVSRVWRALTDYREFGEWFRVKLDGPFAEGQVSTGMITYPGYEYLKWEAHVQKIEPEKRFSYTWGHVKSFDKETYTGDYSDAPTTLVEFRLESTKDGTHLVLEHTGITPTDVSAILSNGWKKKVEQSIPALLAERHSGHPAIEEPPTAGATSALIDRYERGAAALTHALAAIPPDSFDFAPAANAWSARQIAMHIVDAEIVGAERLRMLIAQPHPLLKAYSGDIWSEKLNYAAQPLEPALELFQALRRVTTLLLRSLPADAWARQGVHEETGKLSLAELLASHCEHAEAHLTEIAEIAAKLELAAGSK